jgi:hypothetical protein
LVRQANKHEYEEQLQAKTKSFVDEMLPANYEVNEDFETTTDVLHHRDVNLAEKSPERYCADRCVATGNCDVFEDMYHLSPKEVMAFCKDCVLSEEEEPCDVPDAMFDGLSP